MLCTISQETPSRGIREKDYKSFTPTACKVNAIIWPTNTQYFWFIHPKNLYHFQISTLICINIFPLICS